MTHLPSLETALASGTLDPSGRHVVARVDFNVPMKGGEVLDATRLREAAPTIRALAGAGARVVLLSHRGRPRGRPTDDLGLRPLAPALAEILGRPVFLAPDCIGPSARKRARELDDGGVLLCENLRFHAGEEANDPAFAAELAALGNLYVNDAFGTAHRAHASTAAICDHVERVFCGLLLERELRQLDRLLDSPDRPFVVVTGGAKIRGKIDALRRLLPLVDQLLVGGGMANTFLASRGVALGSSLVETDHLGLAREIDSALADRGAELLLPSDLVVTDSLAPDAPSRQVRTVEADRGVPEGWLAVDIGPRSRAALAKAVAGAATVFWNGPMGVFEQPPFDAGTREVARAVADCPGFVAVGGGETVAAVRMEGVANRIDHVSTGGGASLALLAGHELPAVAALRSAGRRKE